MTQTGISTEWLLQGFKYELEVKVKPKTVEYYCGHVSRFLGWARTAGLANDIRLISKHHIHSFFHHLLEETPTAIGGNGSHRQVRRTDNSRWPYYVSLKRFFSWLLEEGYVDHNPMDEVKLARPNPPPIEPYSADHIKRMLNVLDSDWRLARTPRQKMLAARDRAVLLLFLESGLRCSEMAGLRSSDIDLARQRISLHIGKNGKGRMVGFAAQTRKALWLYLGLRGSDVGSEALWLTEECRPLAIEGIRQIIRRLKKDAGLQHLRGSVHKLRHTFATAYLRHTRDMKGTRLLLGHSTLAMTERYTQFIDAEDALRAYDGQGPLDWLME